MRNTDKTRTLAVGMFIRTIRETGKAPKISRCLKEAGRKGNDAVLCRKMEKALRDLKVYGVHRDGTAFLYKENFEANELMSALSEYMKDMPIPPAKGSKKVEEPVVLFDESNPLEKYSTEDLAAELTKRGWIVTYSSII